MRAENSTVAGVISLNRQILRTSSASAKSDRQSGCSVKCAVMRAMEAGECELLGLAQSIAVRAQADGEFATKKSRCGRVAVAVKVDGLETVLRDEFSLASGEFLSSTAESTMTVDVSGANCANDMGLGEINGLVSDVFAAVGEGVSSSLRIDSKNVPMMSEGGCRASGAVRKCEVGMTPEHRGALAGFGKVRRAVRASKVRHSLCRVQEFGAGKSVSSLAVPVSQAGGSVKVDTGDFEARLIACAVDIEDGVFAEEMRPAIRRPAYALSSSTKLDSKSDDQWIVQ